MPFKYCAEGELMLKTCVSPINPVFFFYRSCKTSNNTFFNH
jgi:hypothetical protein